MSERTHTLYVMYGPPGCGKTTRAVQFVKEKIRGVHRIMITKDDLRLMMTNEYNPPATIGSLAGKMSFAIADIALAEGYDVVFPNTHCFRAEIETIISYFNKKCNIEFIDCAEGLSLEELIKRDASREKTVGADVVKFFWKEYNKLKKNKALLTNFTLTEKPIYLSKAVPYNPTLQSCIICDIDNTLAINNGDRSPFEWMKVNFDSPNLPVIKHVQMWYEKGVKVLIFSGRDAVCAELTKTWLKDNNVPYHNIYMRPEGSGLADYTVKYAIYKAYIENKYNVEVIYDDRQQVVDLWRWLGLTCFQVNPSCDNKPFNLERLRDETKL